MIYRISEHKEGIDLTIIISPLDLLLDNENPRFVSLSKREQENIRKYLVTYEDTCQLAIDINNYGSLLPGERIVVLQKGDKYVVVEGNRRTCALQMLLSRDLIPDGFLHRIPATSIKVIENCQRIEVDVLPNREAALQLMAMRHIEGVKQWKPIAKKQFFAINYQNGQSVQNLSRITGIKESEIKNDIRDYKFFLFAFNTYRKTHPDFTSEVIDLRIDPFLRVFKVKVPFHGAYVRPSEILKLSYDDDHNTISQLDNALFTEIVQLVFEESIVTERINTRNVLSDVKGIIPLLELAVQEKANETSSKNTPDEALEENGEEEEEVAANGDANSNKNGKDEIVNGPPSGNTPLGGPPPRAFFETIRWEGKLKPDNPQHEGLLAALYELRRLSTTNCGRQKAYEVFPIATGMLLRTAYEQALSLRIKEVNLWGNLCQTVAQRKKAFPALSDIEDFINSGTNKTQVLPDRKMITAFDIIIASRNREFLNANIHNPGDIRVTPDALENIACSGMFSLIQRTIDLLP